MPNNRSFIGRVYVALVGSLLASALGCASESSEAEPQNEESAADALVVKPGAVKWHPGHYYTVKSWYRNNPALMKQVYDELKSTSALRGMQFRYLWAELEKTEGEYDFSDIDKRLGDAAAMGKRLIIQVQTKSFNPDWKLIPDYLRGSAYEGGAFAFKTYGETTPRGENIKLWNPLVRNRLTALIRRLGARYNSHPYFEGIGFIETAFGQPATPISDDKVKAFYDNLLIVNQETRNAFPNTMTIQEVNYPKPILKSFVSGLANMGATLSGPDVLLDEPGLKGQDGVYAQYPLNSGKIPIAPSVMPSNYVSTTADRTGREPSVAELLWFARDTLKANYIFWTREEMYAQKVLNVLSWKRQTSDPAGGLDATCPSAYASCVD